MDETEPESSEITGEFNSMHNALVINASFSRPKVAIGEIFVLENNRIEPSEEDKKLRYNLTEDEIDGMSEDALATVKESFVEEQTERYNDARSRTIVTYQNHLSDAEHALIEVRDIAKDSLNAELGMVSDPSIYKKALEKIKEGASAEVAVDEVYEESIERFRGIDVPYIKKSIVELGQHRAVFQHHLHPDKTLATLDNMKEGTLLVSQTFPLHALSSFRNYETGQTIVNGVITDEGSLESHGAILIGSMGVPYARIGEDGMERMKNGDMAIMDGPREAIMVHPNKVVLGEYEVLVDRQANLAEALLEKSSKRRSVTTNDGVKVNVHANLAVSHETHELKKANPVGIGLYRTEIAASMRENNVDEEVWKAIFIHNMAASAPEGKAYLGTTIRTIDLDGDKSDLPKDEREALQEKITKVQMRSLLQLQDVLAGEGHKSKIKVMVPTIASVEEMTAMQKMMDDQAEELGVKTIKLGTMVEVPSLLTELDKLDVAFMSVGSNDLVHSILGIDRYDEESLKKLDRTNPAVLKALDQVTKVGEERNIPVSICGDMASLPKYTALLIGAGFTNMSAGVDDIPAVKEMASRVNTVEARHLFDTLLDTETRAEREAILNDFNERLGLTADGKIDMNWQPPESDWGPEVR